MFFALLKQPSEESGKKDTKFEAVPVYNRLNSFEMQCEVNNFEAQLFLFLAEFLDLA